MSENSPQSQPENDFDPRMETLLETGQGNVFMAEAEAAGAYPEMPAVTIENAEPGELKRLPVAIAAKAEKAKRHHASALPGVELGAVTGRDQSRLIANEEFEKAKAEGRIGNPLSEEGAEARDKAKRIAHNARYKNFLNSILDLPVNEQMRHIRAWEEKHPTK